MEIINKYKLREVIMHNLDVVQKYESGYFDMDYGDESYQNGFWDVSYELVGNDNPDQDEIYYALKDLCKEIMDYNKYCNVKLVVASKRKNKLTPIQRWIMMTGN